MGRSTACLRYLRHSILTSSQLQKLIRNACFFAPLFDSGENLSFFLMAIDMDDFEPFVGGVWNVFDNFFDDGGIVDTAEDINKGLEVEGVPVNWFGVTFDELVDVDRINDGDVDDEVKTAGFQPPRCGNTFFLPIGNGYVGDEVKTAGFPRPRCGKTVFPSVNNTIGWSIDLPSWVSGWIFRFGGMIGWWSWDLLVCFGCVMKLVWCCADDSKTQVDKGSWTNHRSKSIQKRELDVRGCQQRGSHQWPDSCWGIWILVPMYVCTWVFMYMGARN